MAVSGWSDGTHKFLLQYSPKSCNVYPPKGITNQAVVDAAVMKAIDYELVPIIDGEVVKVQPRPWGTPYARSVRHDS